MRGVRLLGYLVAFRILNALLCTTFFQPDEFFQSLEVAHRLVFGYGWQTWEWRQETAIRSPLHAMLFVPAYWLVKVLGLEQTDAIVSASIQAASARSPHASGRGTAKSRLCITVDSGTEDLARNSSSAE